MYIIIYNSHTQNMYGEGLSLKACCFTTTTEKPVSYYPYVVVSCMLYIYLSNYKYKNISIKLSEGVYLNIGAILII